MTDDKPDLDGFAESLIRDVRDRAIADCDRLSSGASVGPSGRYWAAALQQDAATCAYRLIPAIVDQTLFALLDAIDNQRLGLLLANDESECRSLDEPGLGELAGWLVGAEDSWRKRFSRERFFDSFNDELVEGTDAQPGAE
jgi:hypothetical protein